MKTSFTPPLSFFTPVRVSKSILAMIFTLVIANKIQAQSATTFTAANAQITGTLTSGTRLDANCMHVQDTIHADGGIVSGQDVDIHGNLSVNGNITAPLSSTASLGSVITNGSAIFNGPISIPSFSSTGNSQILIDAQGNLFKAGPEPPSIGCFPNAPSWVLGGNNVLSQPLLNSNIGTCDNADFILKANNVLTQYIKPDGSVTFGTNVNSNSGTPEFKFKNGPIRLQGSSNFGGPQVIFDSGNYPYGDWGIEYTQATTTIGGINFWKPALSPNSFNNLLFIGDNGRVGVGTGNLPSRFNVDAWNDDGIHIQTSNTSKKVLSHSNSVTHSENYVLWGDGKFHAVAGQLGFPLTNIVDQATLLNLLISGSSGIKFTNNSTTPNTAKLIYTNNAQNQSMFTVYADGKTRIGLEFPTTATATPYMLAVNGRVGAREIKVSIQNPWPDYVFDKNYNLLSLENIEKYIDKNSHLPNIPSAKELKSEECGLNLGEMQGLQMEKIEEIYLYLIEMNKEIKELKKENEELKKQLKK